MMLHMVTANLDTTTLRSLAVEAEVDPRTMLRVLNGEPAFNLARQRARRVLVAHGLIKNEDAR